MPHEGQITIDLRNLKDITYWKASLGQKYSFENKMQYVMPLEFLYPDIDMVIDLAVSYSTNLKEIQIRS